MTKADDFDYAIAQTRVLRYPYQLIQTFGTTTFDFLLVSELMDEIDHVRIRSGKITAERPKLISPFYYRKILLDGFGEEAREYADWVEANQAKMKLLRYSFQFRKTDVYEETIHDSKENVLNRLLHTLKDENITMTALLDGVDDTWDVCLLAFSMQLIQRSAKENIAEWKLRGFIP